MATENIGLFQAMNAKMNYLTQRQKVISQNVANADTPGYLAQDLKKADFSKMLEKVDGGHKQVSLKGTNAMHLSANGDSLASPKFKVKSEDNTTPYNAKPDGNTVILEEQMMKSNDVQMQYSLMVNLYRDNADMIRTAMGRRN